MTVTPEATQRIRRFSNRVGVLAVVAGLLAVAFVVVATVAREAQRARQEPWKQETIVTAEYSAEGSRWSADGSARVTLPEELRGVPVRVVTEGELRLQVYLRAETEPHTSPVFVGGVSARSPLPFAAYRDSELWIVATGPWSITIEPLNVEAVAGEASGDTDTVLVVDGDVSSAHLSWQGDGWLNVVVRARDGYEHVHSSEDEGDGAVDIRWTPSEFAVFEIYAYDGVQWTLTLDDPAATQEGTP